MARARPHGHGPIARAKKVAYYEVSPTIVSRSRAVSVNSGTGLMELAAATRLTSATG